MLGLVSAPAKFTVVRVTFRRRPSLSGHHMVAPIAIASVRISHDVTHGCSFVSLTGSAFGAFGHARLGGHGTPPLMKSEQ